MVTKIMSPIDIGYSKRDLEPLDIYPQPEPDFEDDEEEYNLPDSWAEYLGGY